MENRRSNTSRDPAPVGDQIINNENRWGCGRYRPDCLQFLCKPGWALFFLCCGTFAQGYVVNGLLHIVLPTLEKRFNLKSSESGLVCSSYSISCAIFLIPATYFGGLPRTSKPLWYSTAMFLLAVGTLMFVIPEAIVSAKPEEKLVKIPPLCNRTTVRSFGQICSQESNKSIAAFWIFVSASLVSGVGGCILYTLAVTYLDDAVAKPKTGIYLGLFYLFVVVGTAAGFVTGGLFLQINTGFLIKKKKPMAYNNQSSVRMRMSDVTNPDDANFYGAWWLGFLLGGIFFLLITIPNLGFPMEFEGAEEIRLSKSRDAHAKSTELLIYGDTFHVKDILISVYNVVKNPTFLFLTLSACSDSVLINGLSVFLPKIMENQFFLPSKQSSMIIGVAGFIGGVAGILSGGLIIKYFALNCKKSIKLYICMSVASCIVIPAMLLHCTERNFAGISNSQKSRAADRFASVCNKGCNCHQENFSPICGVDDISYYSPCYAGCPALKLHKEGTYDFYNCSCINRTRSKPEATSKICKKLCPLFYIFVIVAATTIYLLLSAVVPGLTATLRCVHTSQRTLALGVQVLLVRLSGFAGVPIIGSVIDSACLHWEKKCTELGPCVLYDNKDLSLRLCFTTLTLKAIGIICVVISFLSYRPVVE